MLGKLHFGCDTRWTAFSLSNLLFETEKSFFSAPTFSFLSANTDCVNSQDQTIMVFHRDLSGLMLYLRMKVAKQSPPFLGVVALSVKRFGQRLPKRLDHLGSRCLVEEATVVPDEQKIKMECSWLTQNFTKIIGVLLYSAGNGLSLESFHAVEFTHRSRDGTFSLLMMGLCCWKWGFGGENQKTEQEGEKKTCLRLGPVLG